MWLDPNKTTPFEFYQYWRNIDDADVMKCIRMLTFIPVEEIEMMDRWDSSRINEKKEILAHNLTALVHGEAEADKARATAQALFGGGGDDANMPTTVVPQEAFSDDQIGLLDLVLLGNIGKSKSELRRLIAQGGIAVNGNRVEDADMRIEKTLLTEGLKIKKGKKIHHKFVI